MNGAPHLLVFFRPEIAGDDDARAHRRAVEKSDQHKDEVARRGNSRERLFSQKSADNDGIGRIIKLLKEIAQKMGNAKRIRLRRMGPSVSACLAASVCINDTINSFFMERYMKVRA